MTRGVLYNQDMKTQSAILSVLLIATACHRDVVAPPVGTRLVFSVQPAATIVGQALSPALQVEIQDGNGTRVPTARDAVTIALGANPGGAILSGTAIVNAVAGIATFSGLSLDRGGLGYTLVATAPGLTKATSAPFVMTSPGPRIAAGNDYTCALTSSGAAYCWGANGQGQLGDGTKTDHARPAPVSGNLRFLALSAGAEHVCALTAAGTSYCWGSNGSGELGTGSASGPESCPVIASPPAACSTVPVAAAAGLTFVAVSAGGAHTCGLTAGGAAYCWGDNLAGQLGDGTQNPRLNPTPVSGGLSFASISAGALIHTCGLTTAGAAFCWGSDQYGQLGDGDSATFHPSPRAVGGGHTFQAIVAGASHTCGVTLTGAAYCWGYNNFGQLGDTTTTDANRSSPFPVQGGVLFTSVIPGSYHTCGLTGSGVAYCWGNNFDGELGDGHTDEAHSPVLVQSGFASYVSLSLGIDHTCAMSDDDVAFCWGVSAAGRDSLPVRVVP